MYHYLYFLTFVVLVSRVSPDDSNNRKTRRTFLVIADSKLLRQGSEESKDVSDITNEVRNIAKHRNLFNTNKAKPLLKTDEVKIDDGLFQDYVKTIDSLNRKWKAQAAEKEDLSYYENLLKSMKNTDDRPQYYNLLQSVSMLNKKSRGRLEHERKK